MHNKGLSAALRSHLELYIVSNLELMTDVQPKVIRTLRVPEYFANFRETGDSLACYLGCSIVAKVRTVLKACQKQIT
jgi:actin-related protein 9